MNKSTRNGKGQFKKRNMTAYEAGYDSVINGPDMENCNPFAWFRTPESTQEWERGRDAAQEEMKLKENP